jgi:hypothetical protein
MQENILKDAEFNPEKRAENSDDNNVISQENIDENQDIESVNSYSADDEGLPDEESQEEITEEMIQAILDSNELYTQLSEEDKEKINIFYDVQTDGMIELANRGYRILDSVSILNIIISLDITYDQADIFIEAQHGIHYAVGQNNIIQNAKINSLGFRLLDMDSCIRLLLEGVDASNIINAYLISTLTGAEIYDICARTYNETQNGDMSGFSQEDQEAIKGIANVYSVKLDFLSSYFADNTIVPEEFYNQIIDLKLDQNLSNTPESTYPDVANLEEDTGIIEDTSKFLGAPYDYNSNVNESINLYNRNLKYQTNLVSIPGKNGHDLNLKIIYDSGNAGENNISCTYNSAINKRTYTNKAKLKTKNNVLNEFAIGWSFGFTRISNGYITLEDGSTYKLIYNNGIKLDGYDLSDIKITGSNKKTVTYGDGKIERFDEQDRLTQITDKYNNNINFTYAKNTVTITDTMGRKTVLKSTDSTFNSAITITMPDDTKIELKNNNMTLSEILDQANRPTKFYYEREEVLFNLSPNYVAKWGKNMFNYLTKVEYPNETCTNYGYTLSNWDNEIQQRYCYDTVRITDTKENKIIKDQQIFSHQNFKLGDKLTPRQSALFSTIQREAPNLEKRCTWIKDSSDSNDKKITTYYFNNNAQLIYEQVEDNEKLLLQKSYSYFKKTLPNGITTKVYSPDNSKLYTQTSVGYSYQFHNGGYCKCIKSTSDSQGKYTYYTSPRCGFVSSIEYEQDENTSIRKTYSASPQNSRLVGRERVYVINPNFTQKELIEYTYYDDGMPKEVKRTNGNEIITTRYSYNFNTDSSYTTTVTTGDRTEVYSYDKMGREVSYKDGKDNTTSIEAYDALSRVLTAKNPDGTTKSWIYDDINNTIIEKNEKGSSIKYGYNGLGKIEYAEDLATNKKIQQFGYDIRARLTSYKDGNGNEELYEYETFGRVKKKEIKNANGIIENSTSWEYIDYTNKNESKVIQTIEGEKGSPDIKTVQYSDKHGFLIKSGRIEGLTEYLDTYKNDYLGNRIEELSAMDASKNQSYTYKYTYDFRGEPLTVTNIKNEKTQIEYDMLGRKTKETDPQGGTTEYTYNEFGEVLTESGYIGDNLTIKGYEYDKAGNVEREYITNNINQAESKRDTFYGYDKMNRLSYVKNQNDDNSYVYTEYMYDEAGNLTDQYVGSTGLGKKDGQHSSYTYDYLNRLTKHTDAMGYEESYISYDGNNNLLAVTDKNGKTIRTEYSVENKPKSITVDGTNEKTEYQYYKTGLTKSIKTLDKNSKEQTSSYEYDSFGRTIKESQTDNLVNEYNYNLMDLRTEVKIKNGSNQILHQSYEYNDLNQLYRVYNGSVSNSNILAAYTYNSNGNITNIQNANGTETLYEYESAKSPNLLTKVTNRKYNEAVQSSFTYSYYQDGNISGVTEQIGEKVRNLGYTYDKQGRLKTETDSVYTNKSYTYDNYGNRISQTDGSKSTNYVYDNNNRLITETSADGAAERNVNYSYDRVGNMIYKSVEKYSDSAEQAGYEIGGDFTPESEGATHYSYDSFNRLIGIQTDGLRVNYGYDAVGRRTSKTINGETTNQIWDGSNIVAEDGANKAVYYRGIGLISENRNGVISYYQLNGTGGVVGQTNTAGEMIKSYQYDAFGNQLNKTENDNNPFRYNGEYTDDEAGNIYLRNRYYAPNIGRFTQEDPIKDGLNWYAYCGNNPVNKTDPTGLIPTASEAADMADNIYDSSKPLSGGWFQSYIIYGSEGLVIGVYMRYNDNYYQGVEYALVNKGSSTTSDWINNLQQPFGLSTDMWESIEYAKDFVENHWDDEVTFVGHSKGGAEAAANALRLNKNCIIFNPASVNASAYGLDPNNYTASMTAYIVDGEILNMIFGGVSAPIDRVEVLQRYSWNPIVNHSMEAVKQGLWVGGYN